MWLQRLTKLPERLFGESKSVIAAREALEARRAQIRQSDRPSELKTLLRDPDPEIRVEARNRMAQIQWQKA